ncbi:MAG: hypothetical protein DLM70_02475 [Chloroflexi bacterium]|nr:MAG: hypothetical protein DLM70_02475 [Chloroflexota bacterium]
MTSNEHECVLAVTTFRRKHHSHAGTDGVRVARRVHRDASLAGDGATGLHDDGATGLHDGGAAAAHSKPPLHADSRMMDNESTHRDIMQAIRDLRVEVRQDGIAVKTELAASFQAGLSSVNLAIATLTEAHHQAVIEQERRNGGFAPRDRLDELRIQVHGHSNKLAEQELRGGQTDKRLDRVDSCVQELDDKIDATILAEGKTREHILTGTLGYLILGLITIIGGTTGALMAHLIK